MGQRISIQYTIDVDDLPENVVRLLTNATTEINSLKEFLNDPQGWREKNE